MRRLPITIRLTLVFALITAAVLAATGLFLHARMAAELSRTADDALRSRADDVAAAVQQSGPDAAAEVRVRLTEVGESFSQILDAAGAVVGGTPAIGRRPLLGPDELRRARAATIITGHPALPRWDEGPLRLLATPIAVGDSSMVAVVGMSLSDQEDALDGLARHLLIGGPAALLLATLTGFGLARAALRPVEAMRRRAAAISAAQPGARLPLPATRDELSRLGETLNAMLARLEVALARERAFASDAGHELRTPLTVLKTELDLALRHGHSPQELRATVSLAAEETDRLVSIAEDLLVLARAEHRGATAGREPCDAADLLRTVLERFGRQADRAGRALEADVPEDLWVIADRTAVQRALANMVDNALRHGAGTVGVSAAMRGDHVELHVTDEGAGFPDEFLAHAFERFTRADAARTPRGSGLGLAVVQSIALAHGGSAAAAARRGGGADVWISLPAAEAGTAPATISNAVPALAWAP
ncbi:MAG: ATP-binding protein [Solirubrobacteraceae bacterium]